MACFVLDGISFARRPWNRIDDHAQWVETCVEQQLPLNAIEAELKERKEELVEQLTRALGKSDAGYLSGMCYRGDCSTGKPCRNPRSHLAPNASWTSGSFRACDHEADAEPAEGVVAKTFQELMIMIDQQPVKTGRVAQYVMSKVVN